MKADTLAAFHFGLLHTRLRGPGRLAGILPGAGVGNKAICRVGAPANKGRKPRPSAADSTSSGQAAWSRWCGRILRLLYPPSHAGSIVTALRTRCGRTRGLDAAPGSP
jgi:hypothetical protein